MRSFIVAPALLVKRSGGNQIRSIWLSAEMASYFIFTSSVRACGQHDSREAMCEIKIPVGRNAGTIDVAIASQHALVGCDRARFRPDLSGAVCELFASQGRRLCHQDR